MADTIWRILYEFLHVTAHLRSCDGLGGVADGASHPKNVAMPEEVGQLSISLVL